MFCGYCGKSVKDDSRFCVYCGQRLLNDEGERIPAQPPKMRPSAHQTNVAASGPDSRNMQASRQPGMQPSQRSRQPGMQPSQASRQPGMQSAQRKPRIPVTQQPQEPRRNYYSNDQKIRESDFQTDEIVRQADIQLEQRARQADIQREQEKLASDNRQMQAERTEQGTGRIYSRRNEDRPSGDRQPFEGKRRRKETDKKRSRLPLLIALIAVIAALGAAVWFFVIPMFTSPGAENTITKLEEALNERDNDKLLDCFDRETNLLNENAFSSDTAHANYDLKISETFEKDDANMTAYVTFDIRYNGERESVLVPLPMVKEGKNWYITKAGWDNVCAEIPTKN